VFVGSASAFFMLSKTASQDFNQNLRPRILSKIKFGKKQCKILMDRFWKKMLIFQET